MWLAFLALGTRHTNRVCAFELREQGFANHWDNIKRISLLNLEERSNANG